MTARPIIFSDPTVIRALLDGRKHQTRRVLKPQPNTLNGGRPLNDGRGSYSTAAGWKRIPYDPGDRLYVREAWSARMTHGWTIADARSGYYQTELLYRADGDESGGGWWPSIHMPREFSRLTLTVTEVRVQRLQEISEEDAVAEGINAVTRRFPPFQGCSQQLRERTIYEWTGGWSVRATDAYRALWNSLHGPDAWDANPWVVAISFTVQRGNIDVVPA